MIADFGSFSALVAAIILLVSSMGAVRTSSFCPFAQLALQVVERIVDVDCWRSGKLLRVNDEITTAVGMDNTQVEAGALTEQVEKSNESRHA